MRISVDHHTRYRFSKPQDRLVQMLRLTPQDSVDQTVVTWHIGVDCDARLREARDGFGNRVTMLYADGPLDGIEITVQGEVLTAGDAGIVHGAVEPLPAELYLRRGGRTDPSADLLEFAGDHAGRDPLDTLHRFCRGLHERVGVIEKHHDDGLDAGQVFATTEAAPRDFAHMMIALGHAAGIPGRYVSGYLRNPDGAAHAPHAWMEAHVAGLGWVAFDAARGICADRNYVRVAVALDAAGAAPVAGLRIGSGREMLDVDVQVEDMGGDA
ncbi:transglutaminase family protein [Sphingomonas donggukensis]|uniref:Transglutaminase family protein n=1 Tax=Sphingomonas donggukensis TaxID=2949093 RepID=A0ABY4TZY2_9SPHN|nr:transglutaminase family protein [Sphingomonas donggukensis]URW76101.1 transglutaminase family protein [Sphingomonas donggukensis]